MIPTTQEVRADWKQFAPIYDTKDQANLTFYYTLVNMLQLHQAKHILQVGCGTGKLIPYALSVKELSTTYLATDLTETMIGLIQKNLKTHLQKLSVQEPLEQWMKRHNLTIRQANADLPIQSPYKFDRIIVNMMIHLAEDPVKTLKNLYQMGEKGCLLGINTWGNFEQNNFLNILPQALKAKGIQPTARSNFYLSNKLQEVAVAAGWEVVVRWQQNVPYAFTQVDETAMKLINYFSKGDEFVTNFFIDRMKQIFKNKQVLSFAGEMTILRKK